MGALDNAAMGDVAPIIFDVVRVANPAAGADFTVAVPGDQVWEVITVTGLMTTSAVAGQRRPSLVIDDQTTTLAQFAAGNTVAASSATRLTWAAGIGAEGGVGLVAFTEQLPARTILPGGYRLRAVTLGFDVADQWSTVAVWIRRIATGVSPIALARQAVEDVYDEPTAFL